MKIRGTDTGRQGGMMNWGGRALNERGIDLACNGVFDLLACDNHSCYTISFTHAFCQVILDLVFAFRIQETNRSGGTMLDSLYWAVRAALALEYGD